MEGVVTRVQVLAHPIVIVEGFGLKVLVRALIARTGARPMMNIHDLTRSRPGLCDGAAHLLHDAFRGRSESWQDLLRVGFTVVGVMPDANGPGKPDIFLAKRVGPGGNRCFAATDPDAQPHLAE